MDGELEDIAASGVLRNPQGIEVKYFSITREGAASYAKKAFGRFDDTSPYTLVSVSAPARLVRRVLLVDGAIATVAIATRNLRWLGPPRILRFMPLPGGHA